MIRISTGTAAVLGLNNLVSKVSPTTAYLMQGEKCTNNCSFCAQARNSSSDGALLSRVTWPEFSLSKVVGGLTEACSKGNLKRVCIQVVRCDNFETLKTPIQTIKKAIPQIPLSISVSLDSIDAISKVFAFGADIVNISVDGASQSVFEAVKQRSWDNTWSLLTAASKTFPNRLHTHLIAGLGESEKDIVETLQKCQDLGIGAGLFAFTPIKGTFLENRSQPPLASYRRLQAARFLITHQYARADQFAYDSKENLISLGLEKETLEQLLNSGKTFETTGCQGCNRPYYNESPRQIPYNYPRPLTEEETAAAIEAAFRK